MRGLWTDEKIEILKRDFLNLGAAETSKKIGMGRTTTQRKAKSLGLFTERSLKIPVKGLWTSKKIEILKRDFLVLGAEETSKILNLGRSTIQKKARKLGLLSDTSLKRDLNLKDLDENFFLKPTSEMFYFLGNVFADGSICKNKGGIPYGLKFDVQYRDISILETFKTLVQSHHQITKYKKKMKSGKIREYSRLMVTSRIMIKSLIDNYNLIPRKSYFDIPFPEIPDLHLSCFLLGYLDGDGCVYFSRRKNGYLDRKLSFCGTFKFIEGLNIALSSTIGTQYKTPQQNKRSSTIFKVSYTSQEDFKKLFDFLYSKIK